MGQNGFDRACVSLWFSYSCCVLCPFIWSQWGDGHGSIALLQALFHFASGSSGRSGHLVKKVLFQYGMNSPSAVSVTRVRPGRVSGDGGVGSPGAAPPLRTGSWGGRGDGGRRGQGADDGQGCHQGEDEDQLSSGHFSCCALLGEERMISPLFLSHL